MRSPSMSASCTCTAEARRGSISTACTRSPRSPCRWCCTAARQSQPDDIRAAVAAGVRKINVGSRLKQAYFTALRDACRAVPATANPYEVIGSGLAIDVLVPGRLAMQRDIEAMMQLFGSAGRGKR